MGTPKPDHPWYGRKNHVKKRGSKAVADELLDREIARAEQLEKYIEDLADLDGDMRRVRDPSVEYIEGGLRRMPVRYDSE